MLMGAEENENETLIPTTESPSTAAEEEPIEQVMTQETTDSDTAESSEPTIESEDQERFEETAKFEEDVEPKPSDSKRKIRKRNTRKSQARTEPISKFRNELRKHSDARKRTDLAIQGIQRQLKEVLLVHHTTIRELQKQVTQIQRKIKALDNSKKSTTSRKTSGIRKSKIKVKKRKPANK
jgi:hypothetical protein